MTKSGRFVEIQGSAEGATFDQAELDMMLKAGQAGIRKLIAAQRRVLADSLD
jgi:ribonuclease PH